MRGKKLFSLLISVLLFAVPFFSCKSEEKIDISKMALEELEEYVTIGEYKNVEIPPYTEIGFNKEEDLKRGFYVSSGGITVVPKGAILE